MKESKFVDWLVKSARELRKVGCFPGTENRRRIYPDLDSRIEDNSI